MTPEAKARHAAAEAARRERKREEAARAERKAASSSDGKLLGLGFVPRPGNHDLGLPTGFEFLDLRANAREPRQPTREQWLAAPREDGYAGITVLLARLDGSVQESFGLRPLSEDRLDALDLRQRADALSEATGLPRNDVLKALHNAPDRGTVLFVLRGLGEPATPPSPLSVDSPPQEPGPLFTPEDYA